MPVHFQPLIEAGSEKLAVTDAIGPLEANGLSVDHAREALLLGGRQGSPLAVQPVCQVGFVVPPSVAALSFHKGQILANALQEAGMARLEYVASDC